MKKNIEWIKADLHLHTLNDKRANVKYEIKSPKIIVDFIDTLNKNNIKLFAITNHNRFDIKNFNEIKKVAKTKSINVIPGVEVNINAEEFANIKNLENNHIAIDKLKNKLKNIQCNLLFEEEHIDFNGEIIKENFEDNNKRENSKFNNIKFKDFIDCVSKMKGRVIMILDYGKSQSSIRKESLNINNNFWFYFDLFEGNRTNNIKIMRNKFNEILNSLSVTINEPSMIFGTDNKDYKNYPKLIMKNNKPVLNDVGKNKTEWTGSYFFINNTFEGILSAIDFNHRVVFRSKEDTLNSPNTGRIIINEFKSEFKSEFKKESHTLMFSVGVNVIVGKKGSGKSILIKNVIDKINDEKRNDTFILSQGELVNKIVNEHDKLEYQLISEDMNFTCNRENVIQKLNKKITSNFNVEQSINNFNNEIFMTGINHLEEMIWNDIENTKIEEEELILQEVESFFTKYKGENKKSNDYYNFLESIKDIIEKFQDNIGISNILKSNINFTKMGNDIINELSTFIKNDPSSEININFLTNNIAKKSNSSHAEIVEQEIDKIKKEINGKNNSVENILSILKEVYSKLNTKYKLNAKEIQNLYINVRPISDSISNDDAIISISKMLGINSRKKKLRDIFIDNPFKKNIKNTINKYHRNMDKYYDIEDDIPSISKFYGDTNVSNLSPGQIVDLYIKDIFEDIDNKYKIFIVDQPEDQLDAQTTTNKIINPILKKQYYLIEKGIQIIFVTHDPKLAINLAPNKIIWCKSEKNKYTKEEYYLSDIYKSNSKIPLIVDGKKEFVHTRSKIYGKEKNE